MSGIVFATESFVEGLARFLYPPVEDPTAAAPAEGDEQLEAQPSAFELECVELETKHEFKQLSSKLLEALKAQFSTASVGDIENAYAILLQLLVQWELLGTNVLALADEFSKSAEERPLLRRTLLLSLYNMALQYSLLELRFPLLLKILKYCTVTGGLDRVLGGKDKRCTKVQQWINEWELSADQQKDLWGVIFDAFTDCPRATYEHALKYLPLHCSADWKAQPELRSRLVQSLLITMRSTEMLNCDKLVKIPVVDELATDKEFSVLHRLLQIFANGNYEAYVKLHADGLAALMKKHDLDHAVCQRKMRLLSLVSLAQAKKELTYAAVAKELQLEEAEVETWVMEAISSGLVVAKMDQMRQVIVVTMCLERDFAGKQWEQLKGSLQDWHDQISSLLQLRASTTVR